MQYRLLAAIGLLVGAVLLIVAATWFAGAQERLARLDSFCAREPQSAACGGAATEEAGTPVPSSATGTVGPSASSAPTGEPQLGGAIWYPPNVPDAASIVIAAEDSDSAGKARADVVVTGAAEDEINEAFQRLGGIGGGQVTLLEGRYELDAPIIIDGDGMALVGVNVGNGAGYAEEALGSQVVPSDAFSDGEFLVQATADAYGTLISLIHVDGLDRAQGINVEGKRPTVTLNAVTQSSDVGIRLAGESTGQRPYDGFVLFNRVFDGHGIGILNDQRSGDMLIEGNIVFRNGGDGFRCYGASEMYRMNHAYENGGMGLRIIPGCVRTRLSSNKWEGNAEGGVSIEGGSGFTIVGDTFAHNEDNGTNAGAQLQIGVRGDTPTRGVLAWGLGFGKGDDENPYLIRVGSQAGEVRIGPVFSNGGYTQAPVQVDPGADVQFYDAVPDPVLGNGQDLGQTP